MLHYDALFLNTGKNVLDFDNGNHDQDNDQGMDNWTLPSGHLTWRALELHTQLSTFIVVKLNYSTLFHFLLSRPRAKMPRRGAPKARGPGPARPPLRPPLGMMWP